MKAICPNCQAAYRVADEKVPETGAQIKCPKCDHTFIVKRPGAAETASMPVPIPESVPAPAEGKNTTHQGTAGELFGDQAAVQSAASTDLSQLQSAQRSSAASNTPNLDALSGEAFISVAPKSEVSAADRMVAKGVSTIRAQSGVSNLLDGFRVRTARGLTYDFPSRQAMIRWLKDREDLEGYQAAEPGGDWVGVEQVLDGSFVQASTPGKDGPVVSTPMAPRRASADKLKTADPSKPIEVERLKPVVPVLPGAPVPGEGGSKDSYSGFAAPKAGIGLWIGIVLAFMLFLATTFVTLTRYGLVDFSAWPGMEKFAVVLPGLEKSPENEPLDEIQIDVKKIDRQALFSRSLAAGRRALASKKFSRAALEFNRARAVHPGSAKALDGLARAFMGLGDVQRAKQVMKKVREITGK